jgi:hypothetical protein
VTNFIITGTVKCFGSSSKFGEQIPPRDFIGEVNVDGNVAVEEDESLNMPGKLIHRLVLNDSDLYLITTYSEAVK